MRKGLVVCSIVSLALLVMACGPKKRGDDDDDDVDAAPSGATVTGRVWAPNHGPGQTPPGQEIPISGALVYVSTVQPAAIPDHVYCEPCVATPEGGVLTGPDGSFTLETVSALVCVMGQ